MNTNHSISGVATWSCTNQMYIPFREPTIVYNPLLFKESQVHSRRPITSTHSLYQFRSKTVVPSAPMMPAKYNLTPSFSYSRKVFIGGLPPDIDEDEIVKRFRYFGQLSVDWPHKQETKSSFPPKGYAFLIFDCEQSVQDLISRCVAEKDLSAEKDTQKFYFHISSPTVRDKPVQIRPWALSDSEFLLDNSHPVEPRRTIFVGGVPRPLKAAELAMTMNHLFGGVSRACIDTDTELRYPKGAGRVSFTNHSSYVAAITARFVQLQQGDIVKRAEVKPYVLDDQICDICVEPKSSDKFAPFFCANISCLQYYCEKCWGKYHSEPGKDFHKPLVKEGADRPRTIPFRWC